MWGIIKTPVYLLSKNFVSLHCDSLKATMVIFNSLIVFDTETTGLPHLEYNRTQITEMALMGCEIDHIKKATDLPRVLHKLVFCFNPMKMITPESTKISGLENELLANIKPFNEADAETLNHFINRLPSPVCIVAHNGNKFDFPILQKQLHKLNISLPDYVYCADSLKAFQDIYPNSKKSFNGTKKNFSRLNRGDVTPEKRTFQSQSLCDDSDISVVHVSQSKVPSAPRKLFSNSSSQQDGMERLVESSGSLTQPVAPVQYKLSSIYEFLHGKCFQGGHRAEEDAKALLSCIIKCDKFLNWMNEKAVAFNTIKPLL